MRGRRGGAHGEQNGQNETQEFSGQFHLFPSFDDSGQNYTRYAAACQSVYKKMYASFCGKMFARTFVLMFVSAYAETAKTQTHYDPQLHFFRIIYMTSKPFSYIKNYDF